MNNNFSTHFSLSDKFEVRGSLVPSQPGVGYVRIIVDGVEGPMLSGPIVKIRESLQLCIRKIDQLVTEQLEQAVDASASDAAMSTVPADLRLEPAGQLPTVSVAMGAGDDPYQEV